VVTLPEVPEQYWISSAIGPEKAALENSVRLVVDKVPYGFNVKAETTQSLNEWRFVSAEDLFQRLDLSVLLRAPPLALRVASKLRQEFRGRDLASALHRASNTRVERRAADEEL